MLLFPLLQAGLHDILNSKLFRAEIMTFYLLWHKKKNKKWQSIDYQMLLKLWLNSFVNQRNKSI